jgi:hypothetical protein
MAIAVLSPGAAWEQFVAGGSQPDAYLFDEPEPSLSQPFKKYAISSLFYTIIP